MKFWCDMKCMTEFRKPLVTLRQAWIAWLMVLAMVLAWVGGGGPSRAPMFTGPSAALSPAMAQDEAATLSATWKVQRPSEFRPGHDPDDITLELVQPAPRS